mgnify:CR=1 FL=1
MCVGRCACVVEEMSDAVGCVDVWQVSREACERALQALARQFRMLVK